ncbi:MAG: hypothetical protein V4557_13500 [Bacteroidota bacterium]
MNYVYMRVVAPSFILLPLVIAGVYYYKLTRAMRVLFYYLLVTALISIATTVLAIKHIRNTPLIHIDTIVETMFLLRFFDLVFANKRLTKYIRVLLIVFPVFCCINFIFFQSIYSFNSYTRAVESMLFISFSMLYWIYRNDNTTWYSVPSNWMVCGLLLYFSSGFFLFVFSNYLASTLSLPGLVFVWNFHATLILIMYLLFAIGFVINGKLNR